MKTKGPRTPSATPLVLIDMLTLLLCCRPIAATRMTAGWHKRMIRWKRRFESVQFWAGIVSSLIAT